MHEILNVNLKKTVQKGRFFQTERSPNLMRTFNSTNDQKVSKTNEKKEENCKKCKDNLVIKY